MDKPDRRDAETGIKPAKKPYVKPAFRFEPVFETMALSCGKRDDTFSQAGCHVVVKRS